MLRRFPLLIILAAAVSGAAAQPAKPAEPTFSEVTEVVVVEVPVQVLRDGAPVRALTAADFEIWEGRTRRPITGFEVLDLAAEAATAPAAPASRAEPGSSASARRHFLLLFDLSNSEPSSLVRAQEAAGDLLQSLHPADLVAVATYSTTRGVQLALGFTPDRSQVEAALAGLSQPEMFDRAPDPLRLMIANSGPADARAGVSAGSANVGKETDAALLNEHLASLTMHLERSQFEHRSADVLALTRSFGELARRMSGIHGRKYVIYLSEGFDSSLLFGTNDPSQVNRMNSAATSGEIWNIDSGVRFGSTRASHELEQMLEELRRADCVVQAVDVGGLRDGGELGNRQANGQNSLFLFADGTGGELYRNFNDLSAAMGEMLERTSVTYLLSFQPDDLKRDGEYRKLRVTLKDAPRGTRVVHRAGYHAPRPYAEQAPLEKLLQAGRQVVSGHESGSIRTEVLAAAFRVGRAEVPGGAAETGGAAYVPVVVEIDGRGLLAGTPAGGLLPAEIYVYALDEAGAVRDFVSQSVALDLAKVAPALEQSGLKFFGHLDLPPGGYSLRVLVRNGATGASAVRLAALEVPEPAAGGPVLLPPFFPEPPGRWLVVREAAREGERQVPYPFMAGGEPFIPASLPVLRAGEEARLALAGYGLGREVRIEPRLLDAAGRDLGAAELRGVKLESGAEGAPDRLLAGFVPPSLPPGEYLLRITVTDARGRTASSAALFRVAAAP